jgi:phytoene synthase
VHDPWAECRRTIALHSKSFDLASKLLPAERRDEVAALYAFCRICDDAIDLAPEGHPRAALDRLREALRSVYAEEVQNDAVLHCFQTVAARRQIPIQYPLELLGGMAMDVENACYETIDDVLVYCWRVAGAVGLMMCHVMGVADGRAAPHAAHLGIAMQLTNICRDVAEDWQRGRLYVPAELLSPSLRAWLRESRLAPERPPLPESSRAELASAVRILLARAERYYASADAGMAYLEPRSALAVRTARYVYAEIGRRIEARGCDVLQGRAVVPTRRKLRLAARALRVFASERRIWAATELVAPKSVLQCTDAVRLS